MTLFSRLVITFAVLGLVACGKESTESGSGASDTPTTETRDSQPKSGDSEAKDSETMAAEDAMLEQKVCLAVTASGLEDQSFNSMQYTGLSKARDRFDIKTDYREASEDTTERFLETFQKLIEDDCKLIFGAGFHMTASVVESAQENPDVHFVFLDGYAEGKNITSVNFSQHEGAFLVGAFSALMAKHLNEGNEQPAKVGMIGGEDIPVVLAFEIGFEEGVRHVDPDAEIDVRYVLRTETKSPADSGFIKPEEAYQIATDMYNEGVQIIFNVAGGSGNGLIRAAKEMEKYAIGVDRDQDHMAKGYVLTSMLKRLDVGVEDIIHNYIKGELEGGQSLNYGIADGGISLSPLKDYTEDLIPQEVQDRISEIETQIAEGRITVTNFLAPADTEEDDTNEMEEAA